MDTTTAPATSVFGKIRITNEIGDTKLYDNLRFFAGDALDSAQKHTISTCTMQMYHGLGTEVERITLDYHTENSSASVQDYIQDVTDIVEAAKQLQACVVGMLLLSVDGEQTTIRAVYNKLEIE